MNGATIVAVLLCVAPLLLGALLHRGGCAQCRTKRADQRRRDTERLEHECLDPRSREEWGHGPDCRSRPCWPPPPPRGPGGGSRRPEPRYPDPMRMERR